VWAALKDAEHRTSLLYKTEKCEASKMDSTADVDPFPPLGRGCPEVDEEAQRRWSNFQKMEQCRRQTVEASRSRSPEMAAVKHPESKTEKFPSLSSNVPHAKKASSDVWTNFRRHDLSPARDDSALPIAAAATSDPSTVKRGSYQKVKWKKVQL